MQEHLNALGAAIADINQPKPIDDKTWQDFAGNTTIALMAGGESSRFSAVNNGQANKNAFRLPNDDTMIEMTIRMYRDAGIKRFVALVYHNADSIKDVLGDGSDLGVDITYSYDPERPVGKGGAVRNALDNGSIPPDGYLIVHNPDDLIIGIEDEFPRLLASGHLEGEAAGRVATVAVTPSSQYQFTGMKIADNAVEEIEMYPSVPIPAHIGVSVFSPAVFADFKQLFDMKQKTDFEAVLFPHLSQQKKLHALPVPPGAWLAVNDLKGYKKLLEYLKSDS